MYTSECRTITNVNTVERGRYRGYIFLLQLQIANRKNWNSNYMDSSFLIMTSISLTFKTVEKEREREIHKENKSINYKVYLILIIIFYNSTIVAQRDCIALKVSLLYPFCVLFFVFCFLFIYFLFLSHRAEKYYYL